MVLKIGLAGSTGDRTFIQSGSLKKPEFKKNGPKIGNRRFDHKNREPERLNRFWPRSTNHKTTSFWPHSHAAPLPHSHAAPLPHAACPLCLTLLAPLAHAGDPSTSRRLPPLAHAVTPLPHAGDLSTSRRLPLCLTPIATSVLLTGPVASHIPGSPPLPLAPRLLPLPRRLPSTPLPPVSLSFFLSLSH
uniref:Uncharacterized protein n=1 Tax=Fagus sylvatica TaxID=28930 RepID=A0A2N9I3I0_FAGSY